MRAIDTNIVVRFVANDNPDQSWRARELVLGGSLFLPVTVLLEAEWVLRSTYRFDNARLIAALRLFIGLPGLKVQHEGEVNRALDYATAGMDLADAIHLALASGCTDFVSFDRPLARQAAAIGAMRVVEP